MRGDAAAVPPSTAKNALVMATLILSFVYGTTVPLRLMTLIGPGAVAVIDGDRGGAVASASIGLISAFVDSTCLSVRMRLFFCSSKKSLIFLGAAFNNLLYDVNCLIGTYSMWIAAGLR